MNGLYKHNKISVTTAEFNGFSSEIHGNGIPCSELKILLKIYLGVICAHMVDFCRPGHIFYVQKMADQFLILICYRLNFYICPDDVESIAVLIAYCVLPVCREGPLML